MKFELITLFPGYFEQSLRQSLLGKALEKKLFDIDILNLRDFTTDKHRTVDDTPYGGGGGMVLKVEPIDRALKYRGYSHRGSDGPPDEKSKIVLTSAAGKVFDQPSAVRYSLCERLTIICGHYLGVDERLLELYDIDEVSVGDYILTGGEPAAAVIVDSVARLIPNVLGNFESALGDSHMERILGAPCYTRPAVYEDIEVPDVIMSGNHEQIKKFRRSAAIRKCAKNRPDLLDDADLSDDERAQVNGLGNDDDDK